MRTPVYDAGGNVLSIGEKNTVGFIIKNNKGYNLIIESLDISGTGTCKGIDYYNLSGYSGNPNLNVNIDIKGNLCSPTKCDTPRNRFYNGSIATVLIKCINTFNAGKVSDTFILKYHEEGISSSKKSTFNLVGNI